MQRKQVNDAIFRLHTDGETENSDEDDMSSFPFTLPTRITVPNLDNNEPKAYDCALISDFIEQE